MDATWSATLTRLISEGSMHATQKQRERDGGHLALSCSICQVLELLKRQAQAQLVDLIMRTGNVGHA
jgi:hypothetical protein